MLRFISFLTILFLCSISNTLLATHIRGGTIEYTHISGFTYEAKIITYTKISAPSNQADRTELLIDWGDGGAKETLSRTSFSLVAPDVQENRYTGTHTYAGAGSYALSCKDPNRNSNILNIDNGNSVGVAFYIETTLNTSATHPNNNSVKLLAAPVMTAEVGRPLRYSLAPYDADGDVLLYSIVTPLGDVGQAVPNYILDPAVSVGAHNGLFTWLNPTVVGQYNFAVLAREYRNGTLVGSTITDFQVIVAPALADLTWTGNGNWSVDADGNYAYTLAPNTTLNLGLSYADNNASVDLNFYSETTSYGTATLTRDSINANKDSVSYQWTPTAADVRCMPYILTFRGQSNYTTRLDGDQSVMVYVRDNNNMYCDSLLNEIRLTPIQQLPKASATTASVQPNPFQDNCTFQIESEEVIQGVQLSIFNALGQPVFSKQFQAASFQYNSQELPKGWYIYHLLLDNGQVVTGKMIKQ